jgi:hypothetical protein
MRTSGSLYGIDCGATPFRKKAHPGGNRTVTPALPALPGFGPDVLPALGAAVMNVSATTAKARETLPMASFVIRGAGLTRRIRARCKTESAVEALRLRQ